MMRLPYKLRENLIMTLFKETIDTFDIFFRNTQEALKLLIVSNLKPDRINKDEELIKIG